MPAGIIGREVSDVERAASRFRARASSQEALADAHMMLGIMAERAEGPSAAIPHFEKVLELGSNARQRAECHDNLAETYSVLGDEAKRDEHKALALKAREQAAKAEEEARKKQAEEEHHTAEEAKRLAAQYEEGEAGEASGSMKEDEPADEPAIPELT